MKRSILWLFSLFLISEMTVAYAADEPGIYCLDDQTGQWLGFGAYGTSRMSRFVNVGSPQTVSGGLTSTSGARDMPFSLGSIYLQCRNSLTDNVKYNLRIYRVWKEMTDGSPALIGTNNYISYVYASNSGKYFTPSNYVYTPLPDRNGLGTLVIDPTLVIYGGRSTVIPVGTFIGSLEFGYVAGTGSINPNKTILVDLYATNELIFRTESCVINNNQPLEVDLGSFSELEISASSGLNSAITKDITLDYECDRSVDSNMRVQLVGQPAAFSTTALETKEGLTYGTGNIIKSLGVEVYRQGTLLTPNSPNGIITNIEQGLGRDTLTIAPIKDGSENAEELPLGYFNATATLVLSPE